MGTSVTDADILKDVSLAEAEGLEAKKDWTNELNVFPVPSGDIGTNTTLTITAATREVTEFENPTMGQLARAISSGSLCGVKRNLGAILSQFPRGFTKEIKAVEEIDTTILTNTMVRGTETAYRTVMRPKEGAILTAARVMVDKGLEMVPQTDNMEEFVKEVTEYGDYMSGQTPEMLPVLKQAGVVGSGGQGPMQVVKEAMDGFLGKAVDFSLDTVQNSRKTPTVDAGAAGGAMKTDIDTPDIKFGYCTEFTINLEKDHTDKDEAELKSYSESIGDSLVVALDGKIMKVHVHTSHPDLASEKVLAYGFLSRMKVDNMREEHQEGVIQDPEYLAKKQVTGEQVGKGQESGDEASSECRKCGLITASSEEGLSGILRGIGVDCLIEGGQAMNPSAEDMLKAIDRVNAESILTLSNNKNIIMTAQQARDSTEDKNTIVISSGTVPQGVTALVNFIPDLGPEENTQTTTEEMGNIRTVQTTYAVQATNTNGIDTEEGDTMVLGDYDTLAVGKSMDVVALDAMKEMLDEECELVTIYYGVDMSKHEVDTLKDQAQRQYPDKEIKLQYGDQSIYYYLISAEQEEDVPGAPEGADMPSPPVPVSGARRHGKRRHYHTCA